MKVILEKANTQRFPLTELYSLTLPKAKNYNCKMFCTTCIPENITLAIYVTAVHQVKKMLPTVHDFQINYIKNVLQCSTNECCTV